MSTDKVENNYAKIIANLVKDVAALKARTLKVSELSSVSDDLGDQSAGRILIHKDPDNPTDPDGSSYSGVILGYTTIDGTRYAIIGLDEGTLQFAADPETGEFIAGARAVILNADGITAIAGAIAGWEISETEIKKGGIILDSDNQIIYVGTGASQIMIDGVNSLLKSTNFSSGSKGFQMNGLTGNAEFNDIKARGTIHSSVFVKDEISATAGTLGIYKSAGTLYADATTVASPTTFNVDIKDPASGHAALFAVSDILRLKDGSSDAWVTVGTVTDMTTYYRYVCTLAYGDAATFTAGQGVADYGQSGQGYIEESADGTNAPYISLFTHSGSPWTDAHEVLRWGKLSDGTYGLVGMDSSDTVQFKIDNSGQGSFVNGNAVINSDGITGTDLLKWMIRQTATYFPYTRTGYFGMGFKPTGTDFPVFKLSYWETDNDELVINGGFESGDFSGWTKTTETNCNFYIPPTGRSGDFHLSLQPNANNFSGVLTSDRISVTAGTIYSIGGAIRNSRLITSPTTPFAGTYKIEAKWYDSASGGTLLQTDLIGQSTGYSYDDIAYNYFNQDIAAPASSLSCSVVLTCTSATEIGSMDFDDISVKLFAINQHLWLEDSGVGASGVTTNTASKLSSGVYTPTFYNTTNLDASTPSEAMWTRIGNVVHVAGYGYINPTANTATYLGVSLPIASTFTDASDLAGTGKLITTERSAAAYADTTNHRAILRWYSTDTTSNQPFTYHFAYKIK